MLARVICILFASYLNGGSFEVECRDAVSALILVLFWVQSLALFFFDTRSLGSAISSHGLSYYCYADDRQLFSLFLLLILWS